ncbi:MAG: hypothetical protein A3F42_05920 [Gammaproteobacteria bacterium RIFCSPHIGHO2_12_FULL_37_34]|nr:MAG: hypothetical protein A3F42_05920 [Gammaproteobacteria bacterium RIFCSPHIGHO2_12_FULL_37_34]
MNKELFKYLLEEIEEFIALIDTYLMSTKDRKDDFSIEQRRVLLQIKALYSSTKQSGSIKTDHFSTEYLNNILPLAIMENLQFILLLVYAAEGKVDAQYQVGQLYIQSEKKREQAHYCFRLAYLAYKLRAHQDAPCLIAIYRLGYIYENGLTGETANQKLAIRYYAKYKRLTKNMQPVSCCLEHGMLQHDLHNTNNAQERLAHLYLQQENYPKAIEELNELLQEPGKNAHAAFRLGVLYQFGFGVSKNIEDAKHFYDLAILESGGLHAQALLARAKLFEQERAYEKAFAYFAYLNLKEGYVKWEANYHLGRLYEHGWGIEKNTDKAWEYYAIAGEADEPNALFKMGEACEKRQAYKQAAQYYERAIHAPKIGDMYDNAYYQLGTLYEKGQGVLRSLSKAKEYYQFAASQDCADAYFRLAELCELEKSSNNSRKKIKSLFQAAFKKYSLMVAEENDDSAHAHFRLGWMLQYGKSQGTNHKLALEHYSKAAAKQYPGANDQVQLIQQQRVVKNHMLDIEVVQNKKETCLNHSNVDEIQPTISPEHAMASTSVMRTFELFAQHVKNKEFDLALHLMQELSSKKDNIDLVSYVHSLWAVADCLKAKFDHACLFDGVGTEKNRQEAITAYDYAIQFVTELLLSHSQYNTLENIKSFMEFEVEQINLHPTTHETTKANDGGELIHSEEKRNIPQKKQTQFKNENLISSKTSPIANKHEINLVLDEPHALSVIEKLIHAGHEALFVGGCVRDRYLKVIKSYQAEPHDFDVVTNAHPDEVALLFKGQCEKTSKRFPLVYVRFPPDKIVEVSTFRDEVTLRSEIQLDQAGMITQHAAYGGLKTDPFSRDFTINALYYDPKQKLIIDYVNGIRHLNDGEIRFVIDPDKSIQADPLRMMRAVRFAIQFNFTIEQQAKEAIKRHNQLLTKINKNRLYLEVIKLLRLNDMEHAFNLLHSLGLLQLIFQGIANCFYSSDKIYRNLLTILSRKQHKERKNQLINHEDLLLAAILIGPFRHQLVRYGNTSQAIDRVMKDLQSTLAIPNGVALSIKMILLLYASKLKTTIDTYENNKANLLTEWMGEASVLAGQSYLPKPFFQGAINRVPPLSNDKHHPYYRTP